MGPQLALLMAALAGCLLPAGGCLICATRVTEALKFLELDYLPGHLALERRQGLMQRIKQAVVDFKELPIDEDSYMGVVGEGREERGNLESWERRGLWLGLLGAGPGVEEGEREGRAGGRVYWVRDWRRLECRFWALPKHCVPHPLACNCM